MTAQDTLIFVMAVIVWTLTLYMIPGLVIQFVRTPRNERDFPDYAFTLLMPLCMIGASYVFYTAVFC